MHRLQFRSLKLIHCTMGCLDWSSGQSFGARFFNPQKDAFPRNFCIKLFASDYYSSLESLHCFRNLSIYTFYFECFLTCLDVVMHVEELSRMHLPKAIEKYRNFLLRVHNLCQNGCTNIFAVGLGFGFWIVVVVGTVCLLGRKILPCTLYWVALITLFFTLSIEKMAINIGSLCFGISSHVLRRWEHLLVDFPNMSRFQRLIVLKQVRALKPVEFHCGSVGILKKESKVRYFKHVVKNTIELCLFLRSITQQHDTAASLEYTYIYLHQPCV